MAFSATVFSPMSKPERISKSLGLYAGRVSISSYATTLVECTDITKYFVPTGNGTTGGFKDGIISCVIDGPSSGGYMVRWDATTGAFRCYYPYAGTSPTGAVPITSGTTAGGAIFMTSGGGFSAITAGAVAITITGLVAAAGSELAANVAVGTFSFVAIGFVHA